MTVDAGAFDIAETLVDMGFEAPVPDMARRIVDADPDARPIILSVLGSKAAIGFRKAEHSLENVNVIDNRAAERALHHVARLSGVDLTF